MNDPATIFIALDKDGDPRFDALLSLYRASIPERERKSADAVRQMASSPLHRVVVACCGEAVIGFFLLYLGEIALLEYLAIDERLRGRGFGSGLFRAAADAAGARPLLVEVESDREPTPDRELRARRIGFYRRLGCRRIGGFDFILPLPGVGRPPLLDLLVHGVEANVLEAPGVASWLGEIYIGVYGCAPDDARLRGMIAALPAAVPLD
jgi:ribosomal protein S18 acetylase RimI-like enzyme